MRGFILYITNSHSYKIISLCCFSNMKRQCFLASYFQAFEEAYLLIAEYYSIFLISS